MARPKSPKKNSNAMPVVSINGSAANVVSINLDDEIRRRAYLLSERRGFEPGHETEDWLNAEREVLGRNQQQRA